MSPKSAARAQLRALEAQFYQQFAVPGQEPEAGDRASAGTSEEHSDDDRPSSSAQQSDAQSDDDDDGASEEDASDDDDDDDDDDGPKRKRSGRQSQSKSDIEGGGEQRWTTLIHKGPRFPEPYKPLPDDVKLKYDGRPVSLPPESEEVAMFYAVKLETQHAQNPIFNKNFFEDFCVSLKKFPPVRGLALTAARRHQDQKV